MYIYICISGAPRLLQSIAKDDVIPTLRPFARVTKNNEPFLGFVQNRFSILDYKPPLELYF